jgi:hypothetical protein
VVRIYEIASAEEQIELWKLISSSVWASLQQQEREEKQQRAVVAAQPKVKPKKRAGRRAGSMPSIPKVPTPKPLPKPQQPTPNKVAGRSPQPNAQQSVPPSTLPAASAQSNTLQQPALALSNPQKALKTAGFQPKYGQKQI